ncbi:hypothetical protein Sango_2471800 [Sesamum angolense]|uniref:Uncharacterized protein n=1 Tax=Sesamum angolense TaxID=2727404 RepID=A0AAE2BHW5_9LAMI|nr:hypothetical protein Sango_2471800 [Sesamum angolense]
MYEKNPLGNVGVRKEFLDEEEQTPAAFEEEGTKMDWAQKMIFYAARLVFWSSNYNQDGERIDPVLLMPGLVHITARRTTLIWTTASFMEKLEVVCFRSDCQAINVACNHQMDEESMCHSSDTEAWRHFDRTYLDFAVKPRSVRLGLCTDGFAPHRQYICTYSCWPIILTPYNLPPKMCIHTEYMFLAMVIPNSSNTKHLIDIYQESLIEELQNLWHVGVLTRDNAKNETFAMRAALMWDVVWMEYRWCYGVSNLCGRHTCIFSACVLL